MAYRVYNFTVTENYATIAATFDTQASTNRFESYRTILTQQLEELTDVGSSDVEITVGQAVRPLNATLISSVILQSSSGADVLTYFAPVRRRAQAVASSCAQEYTPVKVRVTLQQAQTTAWVENVVEQAGAVALNQLGTQVVQCADVASTIEAPLQLTAQPPPPPFSAPRKGGAPPPPSGDTDLWWLWLLLALAGALGACCCACFFIVGSDGAEKYEDGPRIGVLGLGRRVGRNVDRSAGRRSAPPAVSGRPGATRGQPYLGLKLGAGELGASLWE